MELRFFGAAGGTTGSCHWIRSGEIAVLLDCGLFQGRRAEAQNRNARFGFPPAKIRSVVLSHAHVDHSGKLPLLVRQGFDGRIHATPATRDLCELLLQDCVQVMRRDAGYLHRHAERRPPQRASGGGAEVAASPHLEPLYDEDDVRETMRRFSEHAYGEWFEAAPGIRCAFHDAGHILGSAWVEAEIQEPQGPRRLVFTGDYGRFHQPILRDPEPLTPADVVISESTYGDRLHPHYEELEQELAGALRRLAERGRGRLLIPAFAVGRSQQMLYAMHRIFTRGLAPKVQVVLDSPLAAAATRITLEHPECLDEEALVELRRLHADPRLRAFVHFTESVDESKALNDDPRPLVIVAGSGMLESGRILHHLIHHLGSPLTEILIVGFQAGNTLGRRLLEGARTVNILGKSYSVAARLTPMLGYSGHADRDGLLRALAPLAERARAVFLVHGENDQRAPLALELAKSGFHRVEQPEDAHSPQTYTL
jgi:metallo-beta-lactamase family protein